MKKILLICDRCKKQEIALMGGENLILTNWVSGQITDFKDFGLCDNCVRDFINFMFDGDNKSRI